MGDVNESRTVIDPTDPFSENDGETAVEQPTGEETAEEAVTEGG
jgi:hypothetical protein